MTVVTSSLYQQTISAVLREQYGRLKNGIKLLAADACVTPRAAQNWVDDLCAPQGAALIRLMAQNEAVDAAMAELKRLARGSP